MVTFNNAGRMGNWLFEAATAASYSFRHGLEFTVPSETGNAYHNPIYCLHLVNPNYNPYLEEVRLWEGKHSYEELHFKEEWRNKNIIIEGYRQTEKYFSEYRNEILALFNFKWELKPDYVSVHVRRGDYLVLVMKHPPVTKEWYESAMAKFPDMKFKFFSDDIKWCKENFGDRGDCEFSTNTNEVDDLVEASWCRHNINSSSTFSWWISWLGRNEDKIAIFPELWFTPNWDGLDVSDIIPDRWIKM